MREKSYIDPVVGAVLLRKSPRAFRVSLRVHPVRGISVTVPAWARFSDAVAFLEARRDWVLEALSRQRERIGSMDDSLPEGESIESLRRRAREELPPRIAELAARYGFTPGRVTIKHNLSNWGSCSQRGNINLNLNLLRLPVPLQDYVMLHELCHLRHLSHGEDFHNLLERLLADHFSRRLDYPDFRALLDGIGRSRSRWRITRVLERAIKGYKLL